MKLNLNLPYKLILRNPEGLNVLAREVTQGLVFSAISTNFQQKMPHTDSKIWAAIQDAFFDHPDDDEIELDSTQYDWLKSQLVKWEPPPQFASRYWTFIKSLT